MDDLFQEPIRWRSVRAPKNCILYTANFNGQDLTIRLNDFPEELPWTLITAESETDFLEWPAAWSRSKAPAGQAAKSVLLIAGTLTAVVVLAWAGIIVASNIGFDFPILSAG